METNRMDVNTTNCTKQKIISTKELNFFQDISVQKEFEMSMIELVDYGYISDEREESVVNQHK